MELSFHQLKDQLNRQGFDIVPIAPEIRGDVRLAPISPAELNRRNRAALRGLVTLHNSCSGAPAYSVERLEEVFPTFLDHPASLELRALFNRYGSDKSAFHDYHVVYAALLAEKRNEQLNILEIGLGTNNIDIPSNMGPNGHPGASVRAFREWAPKADIVGADVDTRILFREERIECHFVDQTDPQTLADFAAELGPRRFDLIIDDGIHTPEGSINTLNFAIPLLKEGGTIVVEDISEDDFFFWNIVFVSLPKEFDCRFVKEREVCLAIMRHRG